jgi:hypothetical protein
MLLERQGGRPHPGGNRPIGGKDLLSMSHLHVNRTYQIREIRLQQAIHRPSDRLKS